MRILILLLLSFSAFAQLPTSGSLSLKGSAGAGRSISQQVDGNETGNKSLTTLSNTAGKTAPHSILEFYGYPEGPPIPGTVTGCSAVADDLNNDGIYISWTSPASGGTPESTLVEVSVNSGSYSTLSNVNYPGTSYVHSRGLLTVGNTYTYRLSAINATGAGPTCTTSSVTVQAAPGPVTNIVLVSTSSGIDISWTNPTTGGTPEYTEVSYAVDAGCGGALTLVENVAYPGTTSTLEGPLLEGSTYCFTINSHNIGGFGTNTKNIIYTSPAPPPTAPTSVTASLASQTTATITWSGATGSITTYRIERSVNGVAYAFLTNDSASPYSDATLTAGNSYTYQIRAEGPGGNSTYTTSNTVTTDPPGPPGAITGLNAADGHAEGVLLEWNVPTGVTDGYRVERSINSAPYEVLATTPDNFYSDTSAAGLPGSTLKYRVTAYNSYGDGTSAETPPFVKV